MESRQLQERVDAAFTEHFGRTPLRERLDDLLKQAIDLTRYRDLRDLREEAGDLLCALLQLSTECDWRVEDLVEGTLAKLEARRLQYASLGRKTRVAILGGSFDPVTQGHLAAAKFILGASRTFDEVWLSPAFGHLQKDLAPVEHRLAMLRLAVEGSPQLKVHDYEVARELGGDTLHMVKHLLEEDYAKTTYDLSLAFGLDVANSLPTWPGSETLTRMIRFVIIARTGYDVQPGAWYLEAPHIYLQPDQPLPQLSSTMARQAARDGGDLESIVPPAVAGYIRAHGLYRQA
ncbi:MAG: nicotinate (nicotinamide) nucleotide adenylyltransferase [Planctomycetes bacterium]|nr:nicotinate (nicotinamide) nucleotide adenylyltransferase [Planctomycetota bacterium]